MLRGTLPSLLALVHPPPPGDAMCGPTDCAQVLLEQWASPNGCHEPVVVGNHRVIWKWLPAVVKTA